MGLPGAGVVTVRPSKEVSAEDAWSKRFILDKLPDGHERLLVLTQQSGARSIFEAHRGTAGDGLFLALAVHLGVLVMASAPAAGVEGLWKKASELPLTWRLGGARA
jgi:hypothetical protein